MLSSPIDKFCVVHSSVGLDLYVEDLALSAVGVVKVELVTGEKYAHTLNMHTKVQSAWGGVPNKFPGIESDNPLKVTEGGAQPPFSQRGMRTALQNDRPL